MLLIVTSACDGSGESSTSIDVGDRSPEEGVWATASVELDEVPDATDWLGLEAGVTLRDGELTGHLFGGNRFGGNYDIEGDRIEVDAFQTLANCLCPRAAVEEAFPRVFRIDHEGDTRMVWSSDEMVVTFELIGLHPNDDDVPEAPLVVTDNLTLTAGRTGPIEIAADGVTLDCAGHRVSGPGNVGIAVHDRRDVTLQNCEVHGFETGIELTETSASRVIGSTILANHVGISVTGGAENELIGNTGEFNRWAHVVLEESAGNLLQDNTLHGSRSGITIATGEGNVIDSNRITASVVGVELSNDRGSTLVDNEVELIVGRGTGFALGRSADSIVRGNRVTGADVGFSIFASGSTFEDNSTTSTGIGFNLSDIGNRVTSDNTFTGNHVEGADRGFVGLLAGAVNTFVDNTGFGLEPTLVITEDTTLESDYAGSIVIAADGVTLDCAGFEIFGRDQEPRTQPTVVGVGIELRQRRNVTIENCAVKGFEVGIGLWLSHENTIRNNTVKDSLTGIWMARSHDNTVTGNTIPFLDVASEISGGSVAINRSRGNTVEGNQVFSILLERSRRSTVRGNGDSIIKLKQSNRNTVTENDGGSITLDSAKQNTVEENDVRSVWLLGSVDNDIVRNAASGFGVSGKSRDNRLLDNVATGGRVGFIVQRSDGNLFSGNRAVDNKIGISIRNAADNTFEDNEVTGAEEAFRQIGVELTDNTFTNNTGF